MIKLKTFKRPPTKHDKEYDESTLVDDSSKKYIRRFTSKHSLRPLGSGAFAKVYAKSRSSRYVYKIGILDSEYYTLRGRGRKVFLRDPYLNYLELVVLKNQHNPIVPKVVNVLYIHFEAEEKHLNEYLYIIKMERLDVFGKVRGKTRREAFEDIGIGETYDIEDLACSIPKRFRRGNLAEIIRPLGRLLEKFNPDLCENNLMWRVNRVRAELVITDPVS